MEKAWILKAYIPALLVPNCLLSQYQDKTAWEDYFYLLLNTPILISFPSVCLFPKTHPYPISPSEMETLFTA